MSDAELRKLVQGEARIFVEAAESAMTSAKASDKVGFTPLRGLYRPSRTPMTSAMVPASALPPWKARLVRLAVVHVLARCSCRARSLSRARRPRKVEFGLRREPA
jgi:hypothetical protein